MSSPDWTEAGIIQRLTAFGRGRDPIEGIWRISGDRYRVAVVRSGAAHDAFFAVVLTTTADGWAPADVKAELARTPDGGFQVRYRSGDHSLSEARGSLTASGVAFDLQDLGAWTREWPAASASDLDAVARIVPVDEMFVRRLSDTTLWLRVPSFNLDRAQAIADLLKAHATEFASTPHLIIDIRRNGGGGDSAYAPLIPLLYTRPIYSIGGEFRAGADNIALFHAQAEQLLKTAPDVAAEVERLSALMAQHQDSYVQAGAKPFSILALREVSPAPRHVAILIDNSGSTAEEFLLAARQSQKVTLFGKRNSAGVLDFANAVRMTTPSGRFQVQWATSRSARLPQDPVDPNGISPDIRIPENVDDPVTFARQWLERQGD
jgi:hypothetical protein